MGALFGEFGALGDEVSDGAEPGGAVRAFGNVGCVVDVLEAPPRNMRSRDWSSAHKVFGPLSEGRMGGNFQVRVLARFGVHALGVDAGPN